MCCNKATIKVVLFSSKSHVSKILKQKTKQNKKPTQVVQAGGVMQRQLFPSLKIFLKYQNPPARSSAPLFTAVT